MGDKQSKAAGGGRQSQSPRADNPRDASASPSTSASVSVSVSPSPQRHHADRLDAPGGSPGDGDGDPPALPSSPRIHDTREVKKGTKEYKELFEKEKDRMIHIKNTKAVSVDPSRDHSADILARLASLRTIEPILGKSDVKRLDASKDIQRVESDTLLELLAGFQTSTRLLNANVAGTAVATVQGMKECKQLSETMEKRVAKSNEQLAKLQGYLALEVSRLQRAVEGAHATAMKCAALLDSVHDLLADADAAAAAAAPAAGGGVTDIRQRGIPTSTPPLVAQQPQHLRS